jgi:hypothetical protein
MVSFRTDFHSLCEGSCSGRQDHEFLESKFVSSMRSTVDDVEGGAREDVRGLNTRKLGEVLVKRDFLFSGTRFSYGNRDTKNGVRAKISFVRGSVKLNEEIINVFLFRNFEVGIDERRGNVIVDVRDCLANT